LRFDETSRVGSEVTEFVDLDPSFETEDAFDVGVGVSIGLEVPE
jgi:hypothetical protein